MMSLFSKGKDGKREGVRGRSLREQAASRPLYFSEYFSDTYTYKNRPGEKIITLASRPNSRSRGDFVTVQNHFSVFSEL